MTIDCFPFESKRIKSKGEREREKNLFSFRPFESSLHKKRWSIKSVWLFLCALKNGTNWTRETKYLVTVEAFYLKCLALVRDSFQSFESREATSPGSPTYHIIFRIVLFSFSLKRWRGAFLFATSPLLTRLEMFRSEFLVSRLFFLIECFILIE